MNTGITGSNPAKSMDAHASFSVSIEALHLAHPRPRDLPNYYIKFPVVEYASWPIP